MIRPTHGVISLGALDMRVRPDHRSEMSSQLLAGEVVLLEGAPRAGWQRVRGLGDGYRGWVRLWGVVPTGAARARNWVRRAGYRVAVPFADLRMSPGSDGSVGPVFLGSRVIAGPARRGWRQVELPDARRGWLPAAALAARDSAAPPVHERIRSLLGTPYLWGGRTVAGLDCSGLVQLVLAEQGMALPRDAHDQWLASRALGKAELPREGDLAFFSTHPRARRTHVGIALGGKTFAHCRGRVRIESLEPGEALFAADLAPQFRGFARPRAIQAVPRFPRTGSRPRGESP